MRRAQFKKNAIIEIGRAKMFLLEVPKETEGSRSGKVIGEMEEHVRKVMIDIKNATPQQSNNLIIGRLNADPIAVLVDPSRT